MNVENGVGRVSLSEDRLIFGKVGYCPAEIAGRKEALGIEFRAFLGRLTLSSYNKPLLNA